MSSISFILVIFASICFAGWYYYEYHYILSQEVPLLSPDPGPTRIKAEDSGDIIQNADKMVYDTIQTIKPNNALKVTIAPEPEQPVDVSANLSDEFEEDIIANIIAGKMNKELKKIPEPIAEQEENNARKTLNVVAIDKKDYIQTAAKESKQFYRLQLVSARSQNDAKKEFGRLQKLHPKLLGSLSHLIKEREIAGKGVFYRLLVGEFTQFGQAKTLCKKLINAKQNCIITLE